MSVYCFILLFFLLSFSLHRFDFSFTCPYLSSLPLHVFMITRQTFHRPPAMSGAVSPPSSQATFPSHNQPRRYKRGRISFFLPLGDLDTARPLSGMVAVERAPSYFTISYPLIRMARHWHRWQLRTGILSSSYLHLFFIGGI